MLSSAVTFCVLLVLLATLSVNAAPSWGNAPEAADDFALRGAPKSSPSDRDDGTSIHVVPTSAFVQDVLLVV